MALLRPARILFLLVLSPFGVLGIRHQLQGQIPVPEKNLTAVPGYVAHPKESCATRTMDQGKVSGDAPTECRHKCETAKSCQCFEVTGSGLRSRCRIGVQASQKTKKGGLGVAYVRDLSYVDPNQVCRKGDFQTVEGECRGYKECDGGAWATKQCLEGLAFNPRRSRCDWPTNVPSCAASAREELPMFGCGSGRSFYIAGEDTPEMQQWISLEMAEWWKFVDAHPEIKSRDEGIAAISILRTANIELTAKSSNMTTSRWAAFSLGDDGQLVMQAVALVEQAGTSVNVMAIVSRRTLINDALVQDGAGKALLGGILKTVSGKMGEQPLTLLGTPGDKFVESLYRSHGMEEYGREETGMPKLRMDFPAECIPYLAEKILCKDMDASDYLAIAWRLLPASGYVKETCAHLLPASLFWKELGKRVGVA